MATRIVIDPGHYDNFNPGTCPGYFEGAVMLRLGYFLAAELSKRGFDVLMTRTSLEQNPTFEERGRMGAGADLFISLHSNATGIPVNPNVTGTTVYYSVRQPDTRDFADSIGQAVARAMGNPFLGSTTRLYPDTTDTDYYAVIRYAVEAGAKAAFLVEHGYHTNPKDCATLMNDARLLQIAKAEARAIGSHFGMYLPPRGTYTVRPGDSLYNISRNLGIEWQSLAAANNISPYYTIYPGQVLNIPGE